MLPNNAKKIATKTSGNFYNEIISEKNKVVGKIY